MQGRFQVESVVLAPGHIEVNSVSTFAGTGSPGSTGDGGPAINAGFFAPSTIWGNSAGEKFIVDWDRVRKIAANGIISNIYDIPWASPIYAYPQDLSGDQLGNLFVVLTNIDNSYNRVMTLKQDGKNKDGKHFSEINNFLVLFNRKWQRVCFRLWWI